MNNVWQWNVTYLSVTLYDTRMSRGSQLNSILFVIACILVAMENGPAVCSK